MVTINFDWVDAKPEPYFGEADIYRFDWIDAMPAILDVVQIIEFADTGVGVDVFLRDWTPIYTDTGSGVEAYYKVYPYPPNLKRVIILIRDKV